MSRSKKNEINSYCEQYIWNVALYIRLSREDGDKEESDSINNQRDMLLTHIESTSEFKLYDLYIDDGFTGTNFNRPNFNRLIDDMENKKVNCIIVKDLSRFGRDYIGMGNFQENIFPKYNMRFIALNDRIDTHLYKEESQSIIVPFKNIINEQYSRDISKKVRSAFDSKRKRGEFIGAFASYGYKKDEINKNKLVVDEEAAETIEHIFDWFVKGTAKMTIAYNLNKMNILCPSAYKKSQGLKYVNSNRLESTNYWTHTSINRVLKNEMYIGNMVQKTQSNINYKNKKNIKLDKDEWIIVENTHQPIISKEVWETTQRLLGSDIKKSQYTGEIHIFAGIVKCGDCGRAMMKRKIRDKVDLICGTYKMYGLSNCTSHTIPMIELENRVYLNIKNEINKYIEFSQMENDIDIKLQLLSFSQSYEKKLLNLNNKLSKSTKLKNGLYEDYKNDILTKEEYLNYKNKYDLDISEISREIEIIETEKENTDVINEIRETAKFMFKFKDIKSLNREMVTTLINSIKIYNDKRIEIEFSFNPL